VYNTGNTCTAMQVYSGTIQLQTIQLPLKSSNGGYIFQMLTYRLSTVSIYITQILISPQF